MIKHLLTSTENGQERPDRPGICENPSKSSKSPQWWVQWEWVDLVDYWTSSAPHGLWCEFQGSRSKFLSRDARKYIINDKLRPGTTPATLVKPTGTGKTRSKSPKSARNPQCISLCQEWIWSNFAIFTIMRGLSSEFEDSRSKSLNTNAQKHITNDVLTPGTPPATLTKPVETGKIRSKSPKSPRIPVYRPMSGVDLVKFCNSRDHSRTLQRV